MFVRLTDNNKVSPLPLSEGWEFSGSLSGLCCLLRAFLVVNSNSSFVVCGIAQTLD